MKKLLLIVLMLSGCAELGTAIDISVAVLDVLDGDECQQKEAIVETSVVNGLEIYRIYIPGLDETYRFDKMSALSAASAMETDSVESCKEKKQREKEFRKIRAERDVISGKVKPQWEKVK